MGLRKHSKKDMRFDETCHITHKGLMPKTNHRHDIEMLEKEEAEGINDYVELMHEDLRDCR